MKITFTRFLFFLSILLISNSFYGQLDIVGTSDYGRIFNITYDPLVENKLYATSLNNHILVSEDNGENWDVLFSMSFRDAMEFQNLKMTNDNTALSFIKYNQDSPENSILIYDLATDSIIKEIEIPSISNVKNIQSYSIYPQDSDIILMNAVLDFGSEENTYYTTDGGQNWEVVYSKSNFDGVSLNNIAINPENPQQLILTRGFGPDGEGGMLISNDAGQTWEIKMEGIILNPIAFNPFNTTEIYVGTGMSFGSTPETLYKSIDSGQTWEAIPLLWSQGNLDSINFIAFNPSQEGHIIVLEENEIVISTDNGVTWENHVYDLDDTQTYYSGWNVSFNPFNENEVFINSDYFPLFSEDAGATTEWKKNKFFRSTGNLGLFLAMEHHLYYGVQYGYVHRTLYNQLEEDFDLMPLNAFSQGDAPSLFVDKTTEGRIFTFSSSWFGADLKVSNDYGQTKHQVYNSYMNYVDAVAANPHNTNEVWFSMSNTMGEIEFWKADLSDLDNVSKTPITVPETGIINGMYFDVNISGKVLITVGTNVYKTMDGGVNWTLSSNGLEELIPGNDLIINLTDNPLYDNQFTISTSKGIFTSFNGGHSWSKLYDGLIHKTYHSSQMFGLIVGIVLSSDISDFALLYSTDDGQNWQEIDADELFKTAAVDAIIRFQPDNAEVFIGSIDLGLMRYTLDYNTIGVKPNKFVKNRLKIYPNPVKNVLTLRSELKIESIRIYSITGQEIIYKKVDDYNENLDLSSLSNGLYLIKVEDSSGVQTHRIVKE